MYFFGFCLVSLHFADWLIHCCVGFFPEGRGGSLFHFELACDMMCKINVLN